MRKTIATITLAALSAISLSACTDSETAERIDALEQQVQGLKSQVRGLQSDASDMEDCIDDIVDLIEDSRLNTWDFFSCSGFGTGF